MCVQANANKFRIKLGGQLAVRQLKRLLKWRRWFREANIIADRKAVVTHFKKSILVRMAGRHMTERFFVQGHLVCPVQPRGRPSTAKFAFASSLRTFRQPACFHPFLPPPHPTTMCTHSAG